MQRAAIARAKAELGVIADRSRADGLTVQTQAYYDAADTAILTAARQKQADLIVMSTHGRSGLNRWVLKRKRSRRHPACCPHPRAAGPDDVYDPMGAQRPLRLLVPLDGSTIAEAALGPIGELAAVLGAELLLTQVVELPVPMLTDGAVYMPDWDPEEVLVSAW